MQNFLDVDGQCMAALFDEIERVCGSTICISTRPGSPSRGGIGHRLGTVGLIARMDDVQTEAFQKLQRGDTGPRVRKRR